MNTDNLGTLSIGVRMPLFHSGDDVAKIVADTLIETSKQSEISFDDKDVICITESIVARAANNYVSVHEIADEVRRKFGDNATVGVLWPIYSRNRFSIILRGIARGAKRVIVQLTHGKDEVGNDIHNKWTDVNIINFYREIIENENAEAVIMQSNNIFDILPASNYNVIVATLHDYMHDMCELINIANANKKMFRIYTLADFCCDKTNKHGYCEFGLYGSNKASEEMLKLFPSTESATHVCEHVQQYIKNYCDANVEVLIYGDGCFKDPVAGIWEFADPVTAPAFTTGLSGKPNEVKLKYLIDNCADDNDVINNIKTKQENLVGNMLSQGTTPRNYVDLLASLADLTSGSGDKGTPVVWIKNYFKNYAQ